MMMKMMKMKIMIVMMMMIVIITIGMMIDHNSNDLFLNSAYPS